MPPVTVSRPRNTVPPRSPAASASRGWHFLLWSRRPCRVRSSFSRGLADRAPTNPLRTCQVQKCYFFFFAAFFFVPFFLAAFFFAIPNHLLGGDAVGGSASSARDESFDRSETRPSRPKRGAPECSAWPRFREK